MNKIQSTRFNQKKKKNLSMAGSSDLRAPQFNGSNYDFCAVKMETILTAYDLWDIVQAIDQAQPEAEGSAEKRGKTASIPKENQAATKEKRIKNAKALSIIQGALEP